MSFPAKIASADQANPRYVVAQLGARMHYAVPRILQEVGRLERFYTDFAALPSGFGLLDRWPRRFRPAVIRRLLGRAPQGIPSERMTAFPGIGIDYALRRRLARDEQARGKAYIWVGRAFGNKVVGAGFGSASGVYCFNTAGLEILTAARRLGLRTVVEQTIAPKQIERDLLNEEMRAFPGWEPGCLCDDSIELIHREQAEWAAADVIVCGSEFVRNGIQKCGGPFEKCVVVPYGVGAPVAYRNRTARVSNQPLRVLTVGTVCLRKGTGYIAQAAAALNGHTHFRVVGPLVISSQAQSDLQAQLELIGPVPRSEIAKHFEWADIFVLPSICEGSATVTYEALSHGLPVVCTANTGSVVRDGIDGFIVEPRNTEQLISRIEQLRCNDELRRSMSCHARATAEQFTLEKYAERLLDVLN